MSCFDLFALLIESLVRLQDDSPRWCKVDLYVEGRVVVSTGYHYLDYQLALSAGWIREFLHPGSISVVVCGFAREFA